MNRRAFLTIASLAPALLLPACSLLPKKGDGGDMEASTGMEEKNTVHLRIDFNKQVRTVVIQLDPKAAPETCANFRKLASDKFYNGILVHRAIPNYLVQMGDPLTRRESMRDSWGTGGPNYTIPAEIGRPHKRGAVAMARLGDDQNPDKSSNGSQFYVCLDAIPSLNSGYTVFGTVVSGIEVLDEIAALPTDGNDVPRKPVEIVGTALVDETAIVAKPQPSEKKKEKTATVPDPKKGFLERTIERIW
jgi:peptidyl-prolyl cis-trans isomerase B (cyclophilin B)